MNRKRIFRILAWTGGILLGLVMLVIILLYLPPVQRFITEKAIAYVSNTFEVKLSVDRLRLRFPLRLSMSGTTVLTPTGDTLFRSEQLDAHVALFPLVRKEVVVRKFVLNHTTVHLGDTTAGTRIDATLEHLQLRSREIELKQQIANVRNAELRNGVIRIHIGPATPDTSTSSAPLLWQIVADNLRLDSVDFSLEMPLQGTELTTYLEQASLENGHVDLGKQTIETESLMIDRASVAYLTSAATPAPATSVDLSSVEGQTLNEVADSLIPWTVRVGTVRLRENEIRYGLKNGTPRPGMLDFDHIELSALNILVDSVYNQGGIIRARLRELAAKERSGLEITSGSGELGLDTAMIRLRDFQINTTGSKITLDALAGASILQMDENANVKLDLDISLASQDIFRVYPVENPSLRRTLAGETVTVRGNIAGELGNMSLNTLQVTLPQILDVRASGYVRAVTDPQALTGHLSLSGDLTGPQKLAALLPDTSLQRRIRPVPMQLTAEADARSGTYSADVRLTVAEGLLLANGTFNSHNNNYEATLDADSIPLYRLLPTDSLGYLTMYAKAQGAGFDFLSTRTYADAVINIDRLDYHGYDYREMDLRARLMDGYVTGELKSENDALRADLDLAGFLRPDSQQLHITGPIRTIDLEAAGLSAQPMALAVVTDIEATLTNMPSYEVNATLDSMRLRYGNQGGNVQKTIITALADTSRVRADVKSGDMTLTFRSPVGLDSLTSGISLAVAEITKQIDRMDIEVDSIDLLMPPFTLDLTAGRSNVINNIIRPSNISFTQFTLRAGAGDGRPLRLHAEVNKFATQNLTLDTVNLGFRRRGDSLQYYARMANVPGNLNQLGYLYLYGNVADDKATLNLRQRDRERRTGLRFGLEATLKDSSVYVHFVPNDPIFGFNTWAANPDNYVEYYFDKEIRANLRINRGNKLIAIESASDPRMPPGSARVHLQGLDIANALSILPRAPEIEGYLGSDILVGLSGRSLALQGELEVDSLYYNKNRVGNIDFNLALTPDSTSRRNGNITLAVNDTTALAATGYIALADSTGVSQANITAQIPGLPLEVLNAFLPEESAKLDGTLTGDIRAVGPFSDLNLNGNLNFNNTTVIVDALGTRFSVRSGPIRITDSRFRFENFALVAPNNQPLTLNGELDLADFSNPSTNLTAQASNFQFVNVQRSEGSMIFGKASADIDVRAQGQLSGLNVRGEIDLLTGSEITYIVPSNNTNIKDASQNVVTFVSFEDSITTYPQLQPSLSGSQGMDVLITLNIQNDVEASVFLTQDGQTSINLEGDGALTYTMNRQGDMRLAGRYQMDGGTIRYTPPVIAAKVFNINEGGYVQWNGPILDPDFDITAVQTVRATVSSDGSSRQTTFNISIKVSGSLDNLALVLDLAAPDDLTLQNELASMTQEQRSNQAMSLLLYNSYTGPGSSATANMNNPLNTFISNEINQWAQSNLSGVDFNVGIDSYDNSAEGGGTQTDYSYQVSKKFFDDRVRAVIGGKYSTGADATANLQDNLVDDISLEYMFSKRDNMFFKVFRQTNYESILEGEVTETGVGFVARKKMSKVKDLFRRTPEKKAMKEVRRGIREEEQQRKLDSLNSVGRDTLPTGERVGPPRDTLPSGEIRDPQRDFPASDSIPHYQPPVALREERQPALPEPYDPENDPLPKPEGLLPVGNEPLTAEKQRKERK